MVIKNIMYVLSVIRKEKQQECYMHITSTVGRSLKIRDMIEVMVSYYALSVIIHFTENINTMLSTNPTYCWNT